MKRTYLFSLRVVNILFRLLIVILPWCLKRRVLVSHFHYEIAPNAKIGIAYFFPKHLIMKNGAMVKHLNVAINLDEIIMDENALIDRSNWITGYPTGAGSDFFKDETDRESLLSLGANSVITKKHHFDCTNRIIIGKYVTIAGYNSQFLTHSIDIYLNRQGSKPIIIGNYCFISTRVTILGGSSLPDKSVLAAGAVLNRNYSLDDALGLYAGVPAKRKKNIENSAKYFLRSERDVI